MSTLRYGIIGIGNMGSGDIKLLAAGKIKRAVLTAVCDVFETKRDLTRAQLPNVQVSRIQRR
jgi:predicted dehydrogenase